VQPLWLPVCIATKIMLLRGGTREETDETSAVISIA
jgi:hypothetical protein